jgi:hypothetical protein
LELLLAGIIVVALVAFVSVPLRRGQATAENWSDTRLADLEARKEGKYAEIRDTQLDHTAGKLSDEDFRRQDAELRAEAIQILKELDKLRTED